MAIDKYNLNLAGEYRVCAELLKRGLFATLTYGNKKGADIYAIGANRRAAVIEVKASNSKKFVTGLYQKYRTQDSPHPDFWVLYCVTRGVEEFDEHFFVLTHDEMALVQRNRDCRGEEVRSYAEHAACVAKGVDNVLVQHVAEHENLWCKIVDFCDNLER